MHLNLLYDKFKTYRFATVAS